MRAVVHSESHRGAVREVNEDALLSRPDAGVWVVADGMGGHAAGDVASRMLVEEVERLVAESLPAAVSKDQLAEALRLANDRIQAYSQARLQRKEAGTTAVVLVFDNDEYSWLWVGDSRGYLFRDRGLLQQTRDHSQVREMVEKGVISPEQAEQHALSNVITRAVGVEDCLEVDTFSDRLHPGDVFLLCSDGLNKEMTDREIEDCLKRGALTESGKALLHSALVCGARDNVSFILVEVPAVTETTIPVLRKLSDKHY